MLHLILAGRGGGKTTFCLNQLKAAYDTNQKAAFLIPEQLSVSMEDKVIDAVGFVGGGIEVFSFNRLFQRLYSKSNRQKRVYMDAVGKTMLISRILETGAKDFEVFKPSAAICSGLLSVISEFKRQLTSPDQLLHAISGFQNALSKRKLTELSLILARYDAAVENNRADSTDNLTLLPELIASADYLAGFSFYIDGFDGFTPQETAVIAALSERLPVFVTLPYDERRPFLFKPIEKTIERLTEALRNKNIAWDKKMLAPSSAGLKLPEALLYLRAHYADYTAPPSTDPPRGLAVFASDTPYAETDAVARRILHLTKQGIRYKDIFVLVPDLDTYLPLIEKSFSDHHLPFFADSRRGILYHPLTRLLLSLCDIFITQFQTAAVFSFLKNDLLPLSVSAVDALEFYVLEAGISGADWKTDWTAAPDPSYNLDSLNATRKAFLELVTPFRSATKGKTAARVFADAFVDFLTLAGVERKMNLRLKTLDKEAQQKEIGIWQSVLGVLEQLNVTLGDTAMGIEKIRSLLFAGFSCCTVGLIPPTCDHITVSTADRTNFQDARVLFLTGVTEGAFPVQQAGSGMLTDTERAFLEENGIVLSATNREKALFSPYTAYMTLTQPKALLCLSYPVSAKSGEALSPASVIQELCRMFPHLSVTSELMPSDASVITTPEATLPYFLKRHVNHSIWQQVYGWYLSQPAWQDKIPGYLSSRHYTLSWKLSEQMALKLWGETLHTSISRLESFAACPLSFFLTYGLKVKERKVHAFTPPEAGSMMHEVMETFVQNAILQNADFNLMTFETVRRQTLDICQAVIDKQIALFPSVSKRYAFLLERIKNSTVNAVWAVAHHIRSGIFKPYATEFTFTGQDAPVFQTQNGNTLVLTGKIDRIDTSPDGYRIIDYKSGNKDLSLSAVAAGSSLQLPIYSLALRTKLGTPHGMFYLTVDAPLVSRTAPFAADQPDEKLLKEYKMAGYTVGDTQTLSDMDRDMQSYSNIIPAFKSKDGKLSSGRLLSEEEYSKIERLAVEKVKAFGDAILQGSYPIAPLQRDWGSACTYCAFRSVCRFDPSYCAVRKEETHSDAEILGREEEDQNG